mmetsp:Transcript_26324/g.43971  ORF Transcript_26324/g.43971 Transcript_26324/m.43971 type:complete len:580 (+) Transcript_26324:242-1981(+)
MSRPIKMKQNNKHNGIDALLISQGKSLAVGQEIRFALIKGPSGVETVDICNPKAPPETFPVVAKFSESVVKPDFTKFKRFYQQDIPSQKDDSDEEAAIAVAQLTRKKRRYRRNDGPKRQWVLQKEEDYLLTMIAQKEQGKQYKQNTNIVSSRYEGLPEHNPSHYVLIGAPSAASAAAADGQSLQVTMLPTPHAVFNFSQPAKNQTMSMTEAEQAIENQRSNTTRYMMHQRGGAIVGQPAPVANSKARLLGRLKALSSKSTTGDDADDDDVMGDVKFATRKGSGSRARKELLSSMADGVSMDADGVLGGANDAEFGGRRRFTKMKVEDDNAAAAKAGAAGNNATSNDGMAMADDFYQRDVKAEYEELDYDANEQFDDDDVDMAEGEVNMVNEFQEELEDDDDVDDDEEEDEDEEKKAGLASIKGLKDMLAKARGEAPTDGSKEGEKKEEDENGNPISPSTFGDKKEPGDDSLADVMAAAERTSREAEQKAAAKKQPSKGGVRFDANGQRVLDMESVRYEIFLHNKSIAMKKLMKLYNIKKKSSPERISMFQNIIRELCNMSKDPVHGNILVLKQHYSKSL